MNFADLLHTFSDLNLLIKFVLIVLVSVYGLFAIILAFQIATLDRMAHQVRSSVLIEVATFVNVAASLILLVLLILSL